MRTCVFFRMMIADRFDSQARLPDWVQNHLDQCEPCRSHYGAQSQMAERLVADARRDSEELPPFLHGKIMAAIRRKEATPVPRSFRPVWFAGAAAALVLLGGLSLRFLPSSQNPSDPNVLAKQTVVDPAGPLAPVLNLASRDRLMALSRNLDQSLEEEFQFVMSDAKTAIQSLAHNFIPEQMIAQSRWP